MPDATDDYLTGARAAKLALERHGAAAHSLTRFPGRSPTWIMGWEDTLAEHRKLKPTLAKLGNALVADVESAAEAAAKWSGWEWAHDPGGHGIVMTGPGAVKDWDAWERKRRRNLNARHIDSSDEMTHAEIREALDSVAAAERAYGEAAQDAADSARDLGKSAVEQAKKGYYKRALDFAEQAQRLEDEYGDAPSYSPLVEACEALAALA